MDDLTARATATYDRIAAAHASRSEHPDAAFRAFRARSGGGRGSRRSVIMPPS